MQTVPAAFAAVVHEHAQRTAVIGEDGRRWTYAELEALRLQAARALIAHGVQHGDCVAIWAPNGIEWIIAGLAIHAVGAALVPVNTRMRGEEAADVLARSRTRLLFCVGDFLKTRYPEMLAPHRPSSLQHVVVLGSTQDGDLGWNAFMASGDSVSLADVESRIAAVQPDDRLDVLYTSGTTGRPKGVVSTHAQNLRVIAAWSRQMALVPEDRYLVVNPFFHSFGYKVGWLGGLLAGLTVLPHAVFDAAAVMRRIAADRISVLPGPPTLFISLLEDPARAQTDLSSLRATVTGAATIAPSLIERIRAELGFKIVLTAYGLTETCGVVTMCSIDDDAETIARTCGRAIEGIELACVDDNGKPVAPGESGEVVVRGYNVMQGYLDDEAATQEAIDAQGWLHTGDVGNLDERGNLRITDRLKDMYITGGFNCYPAEIERLMAAHPAIAQLAVIGIPDERQGEVGCAYIVPRAGSTVDAKDLISWCRERMANYKVPREVVVVSALPTNPSGKVLKYQLRTMSSDRARDAVQTQASSGVSA